MGIEMDWENMAFLILVTMALTQLFKHITGDKIGWWAMAVAIAIGFLIVFIAEPFVDWRFFVQKSLFVGVGASGLFIGLSKVGQYDSTKI